MGNSATKTVPPTPSKHKQKNITIPASPTTTKSIKLESITPMNPPPLAPITPVPSNLSRSLPSTPIPRDVYNDDDNKLDDGFPTIQEIPPNIPTNIPKLVKNKKRKKKRFGFRRKIKKVNNSTNQQKNNKKSNITKEKPNNGVTGIYISHKTTACIGVFWKQYITTLSDIDQLELGCSIYFTMLEKCDNDFKLIFRGQKIEHIASKFLNMITWLIESANNDKMDLKISLKKLRKIHKKYGVKIQFFEAYLDALHDTLSEYFPNDYGIDSKYCLDQIFTIHCQIMVGKSPKLYKTTVAVNPQFINNVSNISINPQLNDAYRTNRSSSSSFIGISHLTEWNESRSLNNCNIWLKNLNACLKCDIGREYFFLFLRKTCCFEIVIFLELYWEFHRVMSEKEKFMVARKIAKTSVDIDNTAPFPLNISYDTKNEFIKSMDYLEKQWLLQCNNKPVLHNHKLSTLTDNTQLSSFVVKSDLLDKILYETKRLMLDNHWQKFCSQVQLLQRSSSQSYDKIILRNYTSNSK